MAASGAALQQPVKAVGPDVIGGTVRLTPHRDGVAGAVKGNLGLLCVVGIVGLNELGRI